MSDDEIREKWREVRHSMDNISLHVVDGALWQIGNNWGEQYWKNIKQNKQKILLLKKLF